MMFTGFTSPESCTATKPEPHVRKNTVYVFAASLLAFAGLSVSSYAQKAATPAELAQALTQPAQPASQLGSVADEGGAIDGSAKANVQGAKTSGAGGKTGVVADTVGAGYAGVRNLYGSIAFDPTTGASGFSYNHHSSEAAEADAVRRCGRVNCRSMMWFGNGCGALAVNGYRYGAAVGSTRGEAQTRAVNRCAAGNCRVLTWACTDRRVY
jgi:hypothetical protein